ncbi:HigA protein (antitoxin to HigB) [Rhodovulum sp. P5]|uniref:helix-turn-helix domain-containing protein n=1 Tax=Rhodovulum sp. P5 TaxID=1564506 RepID=UPI0009C293F9|nr:helix-turn-helix transcriptional regulator [Rhodovulum sp. P5]ARE39686.1 HigA protein (antitoxin to HigB) [Rhodovulum sp. P5]
MPSSVLAIFGENLKDLCQLRESPARVARDLDISRVQMHRYMSGESFPKPNQLKQICDYFGVDARILTERLTATQMDELVHYGRLLRACESNLAVKEAVDYVGDFDPFFVPSHELGDGLYLYVTRSQLHAGMLGQALMQVKTLRRGRVVRTVLPRQYSEGFTGKDERETASGRDLRGIVLRHVDGYCLQFFNSNPRRVSSMIFLSPALNADLSTFEGIYMIAQGERQGVPRVSRCLLQRIEPSPRNIVAAAHRPPYIPFEDAPLAIRDALSRPVE